MGTDSICGDPEGMGEKGTHGEGMCDPEICGQGHLTQYMCSIRKVP